MIVTRRITIDDSEIEESFLRASGPGGQNVNKVETAVQLRFNVASSPSLPEDVRQRLIRLVGPRLTGEGVLIITAQRFRSQERNREDARQRLADLIRRAAEPPPPPRKPTRPTKAATQRRLEGKTRRAGVKKLRGSLRPED